MFFVFVNFRHFPRGDVLVEGGCANEHAFHIGDLRHVPLGDVLVEGGGVVEEVAHVGDRRYVPLTDGHATLLQRAEPVRGLGEARVDRGLESGAVREDRCLAVRSSWWRRWRRIAAAQHQYQRQQGALVEHAI